ncbi:hypothetical protein Dimus_019180 [Dionaea muscipula]
MKCSKAFLLLGFLFAVAVLIASQVSAASARELTESTQQQTQLDDVEETNQLGEDNKFRPGHKHHHHHHPEDSHRPLEEEAEVATNEEDKYDRHKLP